MTTHKMHLYCMLFSGRKDAPWERVLESPFLNQLDEDNEELPAIAEAFHARSRVGLVFNNALNDRLKFLAKLAVVWATCPSG